MFISPLQFRQNSGVTLLKIELFKLFYQPKLFVEKSYRINYNTKYGIYDKNCGLSNVLVSFGHDEYLYQVLRQNKVTLPQEALYIIRFHSLYPHHKHNAYHHLLDMKDLEYFHWLKLFNKYDLYTKSENNLYNIDQLKSYYQNLINKYLNNDSLYW